MKELEVAPPPEATKPASFWALNDPVITVAEDINGNLPARAYFTWDANRPEQMCKDPLIFFFYNLFAKLPSKGTAVTPATFCKHESFFYAGYYMLLLNCCNTFPIMGQEATASWC